MALWRTSRDPFTVLPAFLYASSGCHDACSSPRWRVSGWLAGCSGGSSTSQQAPPTPANEEWFDEYAAEAGIDFVHFNGMSGQLYYPEIMGPGVRPSGRIRHGDLEQRLGGGRGWRRLAGGADHDEQQDAAAADH